MQKAIDTDSFIRSPIGQWVATRSTVAWVASNSICGIAVWGRPTVDDVRADLQLFEALYALDEGFDLIMDGSALESVDLDAVAVLIDWSRRHLDGLRSRFRRRVGIIPAGVDGLMLAGISPVVGWNGDISIASDVREALRLLNAPSPDSLADEIETIVRPVRETSPLLIELRTMLRNQGGNVTLTEATRSLRVSPRSLQRALAAEGSSFRREEQTARFDAATRLLTSTDEKIAVVASRLGVTSRALAQLIRTRSGVGPMEFRGRSRQALNSESGASARAK